MKRRFGEERDVIATGNHSEADSECRVGVHSLKRLLTGLNEVEGHGAFLDRRQFDPALTLTIEIDADQQHAGAAADFEGEGANGPCLFSEDGNDRGVLHPRQLDRGGVVVGIDDEYAVVARISEDDRCSERPCGEVADWGANVPGSRWRRRRSEADHRDARGRSAASRVAVAIEESKDAFAAVAGASHGEIADIAERYEGDCRLTGTRRFEIDHRDAARGPRVPGDEVASVVGGGEHRRRGGQPNRGGRLREMITGRDERDIAIPIGGRDGASFPGDRDRDGRGRRGDIEGEGAADVVSVFGCVKADQDRGSTAKEGKGFANQHRDVSRALASEADGPSRAAIAYQALGAGSELDGQEEVFVHRKFAQIDRAFGGHLSGRGHRRLLWLGDDQGNFADVCAREQALGRKLKVDFGVPAVASGQGCKDGNQQAEVAGTWMGRWRWRTDAKRYHRAEALERPRWLACISRVIVARIPGRTWHTQGPFGLPRGPSLSMSTPTSQTPNDDLHLPLPRVFGRYLLLERLSRGGMGEIFVAKYGLAGFEKLCVIKKVLPNLAANDQFISRFIDEANVAIKLQHANIAQVIEVGRVGGEYFLSIEFVEGRDLRRTQAVLAERGLRFPHDVVLHLVRELANGLAYAHRRSDGQGASLELVHCDISPPNIVVSFEGETKIIDFGIAKSTARATETDPSMGFGKFGYMAPEQLIRGGKIDHRTDIYAAGVVLFEMLTGQRLYDPGEVPDYRALARKVARGEHARPSDIDPALAPYDALVARCLAPNPDHRFATGALLRDELQRALVAINPTMNADRLGEYMRELFRDELSTDQAIAAKARQTTLAAYERELTTQGAEAVSYAVANLPLLAPPTESVSLQPPRRRDGGVERRPAKRNRKRAVVVAALSLAIGAGAAAAVLQWRSDDGRAATATAPAVVLDPTLAPGPTVEPLAAEPLAGKPGPAGLDSSAAAPLPGEGSAGETSAADAGAADTGAAEPNAPSSKSDGAAAVKPATASTVRRQSSAGERPGTSQKAAPSAAAVHAKFKAISKEYRGFAEKYGGRLEAAWTEIATSAQYARDNASLADLDSKLDRFRSRMRAVE